MYINKYFNHLSEEKKMNKFFAMILMMVVPSNSFGLTQEEFSDEDFIRFMYNEPNNIPELNRNHLKEYFRDCQTPKDEEYNNWNCMKLKAIIQNYVESSR